MEKITVRVNHNRCVGSKLCVMFSPGVFALNERGQSTVVSIEGVDPKKVIATAEQCPQCAIVVEDADSGARLFPPPGF